MVIFYNCFDAVTCTSLTSHNCFFIGKPSHADSILVKEKIIHAQGYDLIFVFCLFSKILSFLLVCKLFGQAVIHNLDSLRQFHWWQNFQTTQENTFALCRDLKCRYISYELRVYKCTMLIVTNIIQSDCFFPYNVMTNL